MQQQAFQVVAQLLALLELVHFSLERARASAPRLRAAPGPALGLGRRVCKGITARPARLSHRHPHLPAAEGEVRRLQTREGDASFAMGLSASEADALALAHRMRAGLAHQTRDRWWRDLRFYRQCFLGADAVQVRCPATKQWKRWPLSRGRAWYMF